MKNVMIVESPKKAKCISQFLGDGWSVYASVGHVCDLPDDELGIDKEKGFLPSYVVTKEKRKLLDKIKRACKFADNIYLATDDDREGEAIAFHLMKEMSLPPEKCIRIKFNEVSEKAVNYAIDNPESGIDMHLFSAQECRRVLDRLFGYMVSPVLAKESGIKKASAGRVQSPALSILSIRQNKIDNFKPKAYYELKFIYNSHELSCVNTTITEKKHIFDKQLLLDIANKIKNVKITCENPKITSKKPKPVFETSTLLQYASSKLNIKAKETKDLSQSLFTKGYITYHRTDSTNISDERFEELTDFLSKNNIPHRDVKLKSTNKKNSQNAHEGICPTKIEPLASGELSGNEKRLYDLIRERFICSGMTDGKDEKNTVLATAHINETLIEFTIDSIQISEEGWRKHAVIEKPERPTPIKLPELDDELIIQTSIDDFKIETKKTNKPKRLKEADLVSTLEKLSIGRPSTYANIIGNLEDRGYIKYDKKGFIIITDIGKKIVKALNQQQFMNLQFTQDLESKLDEVAKGNLLYLDLVSSAYEIILNDLPKIKYDK